MLCPDACLLVKDALNVSHVPACLLYQTHSLFVTTPIVSLGSLNEILSHLERTFENLNGKPFPRHVFLIVVAHSLPPFLLEKTFAFLTLVQDETNGEQRPA